MYTQSAMLCLKIISRIFTFVKESSDSLKLTLTRHKLDKCDKQAPSYYKRKTFCFVKYLNNISNENHLKIQEYFTRECLAKVVTSLSITKSVLNPVQIKIPVYLYKVVIHISLKLQLRVTDTVLMCVLYFILVHSKVGLDIQYYIYAICHYVFFLYYQPKISTSIRPGG